MRGDISWSNVGKVGSVIAFVFVITATSNGVNLTDGLDGLATGASVLVFGAYALIGSGSTGTGAVTPTTRSPSKAQRRRRRQVQPR